MTRGEVWGAWFGVRSRMVSVFASDTVRPAALQMVSMTVIIFCVVQSRTRMLVLKAYGKYVLEDIAKRLSPFAINCKVALISTLYSTRNGGISHTQSGTGSSDLKQIE